MFMVAIGIVDSHGAVHGKVFSLGDDLKHHGDIFPVHSHGHGKRWRYWCHSSDVECGAESDITQDELYSIDNWLRKRKLTKEKEG